MLFFASCYRPQTKFEKVMFSQVSVCPQRGRAWRGCGRGACMAPPTMHAHSCPPTCGQCAGDTHPTGMHSCVFYRETHQNQTKLTIHWRIQGSSRDTPLLFLSFSCSYWQKSFKIIRFCSKVRGWYPRSSGKSWIINCNISFKFSEKLQVFHLG